MAYDTSAEIIETACVLCGLTPVADPYSSLDDIQIQMRTLLNQCGRALYNSYQWQQFVTSYTISTGSSPVSSGEYDLPSDFGYFINQTGWTPANVGMGLPLGGPLTEQQWAYIVNTNLASSTIYVSFRIADGVLCVLPAPAPEDIDITFAYVSNSWATDTTGATGKNKCDAADDIVKFDPVLISTMLALRYKQAKGLNSKDTLEEFQTLYAQATGVNTSAPVLSMVDWQGFPYLNPWTNIPQSGFGS